MQAAAAATGSAVSIPEELRTVFDATYAEVLAFADASWLVRFLHAVEGMEHRLSTYANALRLAVERASADVDDSDDVDLWASLWGLLSFLRSSHDTGQITDADYVVLLARLPCSFRA